MKFPSAPKKALLEDLVPLINVVFLLLIFFMLSAKLNALDDIEIEPPVSTVEAEQEQHTDIRIYLTAHGEILYSGDDLSLEALIIRLVKKRSNLPGTKKLLIKADAHTPVDRLLSLLTVLSKNGFDQIELLARIQP
jgi:biopolymer transport protein ExbD